MALLVFFKGLVRYARLRAHRLRLFDRLQARFPTLVTFPHALAYSTTAVFERSTYGPRPPAREPRGRRLDASPRDQPVCISPSLS